MTGPTGTATFHLCHCIPLCTLSGREYAVVALSAFEDTGMKLVTEKCRAGFLDIKNDLFGCHMTAAAIAFDRKCQKAIMAGTAGSVLFHISHGIALVFAVRGKKCIMAVTATIHFKMPQMRKAGICSELYILYRVTFTAIPGN